MQVESGGNSERVRITRFGRSIAVAIFGRQVVVGRQRDGTILSNHSCTWDRYNAPSEQFLASQKTLKPQ